DAAASPAAVAGGDMPPFKAVLILSGCPGDAKRYRCDHQAEQLETLGVSCEVGIYGQYDFGHALRTFAGFVFHRVPFGPDVDEFIAEAHASGRPVIFDTDDWVFDLEAAKHVAALDDMDRSERDLYLSGLRRYRDTLRRCDGCVVTTTTLARLAQDVVGDVRVCPNVVSQEMIELAAIALARRTSERRRRRDVEPVRVAYLSGTPTHKRDFAVAESAIEWALETFPEMRLVTVGHIEVARRFERFADRLEHLPLMPWRSLIEATALVDVNLAPLEPDNPFTASKSCIKYLEAAIVGVPTIASPLPDFERVIEHGRNGLLAASDADWRDGLRRLVESRELREQIGRRAREDVLRHHSTRANRQRLVATLSELAPRDPDEPLTINWIVRAPIAGTGGGYKTIFQLANALADAGHRVRVYVEPIAHLAGRAPREIESFVEEHFGPLRVDVVADHERIEPCDWAIATNWPTAYTVARLANALFRAYFVQDYEPDFYSPEDPNHREAEATYTLALQPFCIGAALGARIAEVSQRPVEVIDFAVDGEVFRTTAPPAERPGPPVVLFFARPSLKRRGYDVGVRALARLLELRPDVRIRFFGASDGELGAVPFRFENLGVLAPDALARAMNEAHVLLSFSLSANISWVPFQGMACGCAVVEADLPPVRAMVDAGRTCLLAEPNPEAVARALERLVADGGLRARIATAGGSAMANKTWASSARAFERKLVEPSFVRLPSGARAQGRAR